jgi:chromosome partitioning protein
MKTLAICCQKGGVGKTTLVTELAVAFALQGHAIAVADCDPQETSCLWRDLRGKDDCVVQALPPELLDTRLKALSLTGCDLAIIDTPPVSKDTSSAAIRQADLVLIPTRPAAFDLKATQDTIHQCRTENKPYVVVITFAPSQKGAELTDSLAALAQTHTQFCPVLIHQYVAYPRAQKSGASSLEIEPNGKAAGEIRALADFLAGRLGLASGSSTSGIDLAA